MKKVFMSAAIVAIMAAAVACGNNANKKAEAPAEEATECVEEKSDVQAAAEEAVDAVKEAASEKAVEGINAAADAAVEAISK